MSELTEPEQRAYPKEAGQDTSGQMNGSWDGSSAADRTIFPSLQELRDLPQRILPEQTYTHLQNAGREALLALYSLWRSIDAARNGQAGNKVRKHIDVE